MSTMNLQPNWLDLALLADQALADYDFGAGVEVTDLGSWEYVMPEWERSRKVYLEGAPEDDGPPPRWTLIFTVRFDRTSGALDDVYALDGKGQIWGRHLPCPSDPGVADQAGAPPALDAPGPDPDGAARFFQELLADAGPRGGLAVAYPVTLLADLMHLQQAILTGARFDAGHRAGATDALLARLASGTRWHAYTGAAAR